MRTYRVTVHGMFAPISTTTGLFARGFYTARTVTAPSRDTAALEAFAAVQATPRLLAVIARAELEAPELAVATIVDLGPGTVDEHTDHGFIFYDESAPKPEDGYFAME